MTCAVPSCGKPAIAKGFCKPHWHRKNRYGDPTAGMYREGEGSEWLHAHVNHSGDDCLKWPFGRNGSGYGAVGFRGERIGAHRAMCILVHGEPPSGNSHAAHTCGNGHLGCVNPLHLRWATQQENQSDRVIHGTSPRGEGNGCAILSASSVQDIRSRLDQGETQTSLAKDYGVSISTIHLIKTGRNWGWLRKESA